MASLEESWSALDHSQGRDDKVGEPMFSACINTLTQI